MEKLLKNLIVIFKYLKKNVKRSHLIMFLVGLGLVFVGIISWNVYFSKYYLFSLNEDKLYDAVVDYYDYHSIYLPKNGSIKTITLGELYQKDYIETLYIPKSDRLCDTDLSWVKVYNDNGKYKYYTYLKCGKYQTRVDHTGPVITLNGDSTIYVSLNHDYNELGVKEVKDDSDGKINVKNVVIDNSKVNTKKVGKYYVTYTVRDKLNNETVLKRTVNVIRNLTDIVKDDTDDSGYYKGAVDNNYILFSGMLYRIINVNSDGTVRLISNEILNNFRFNYEKYENSNIDKYLNTEYLDIIHDKSYLVDTEFCVGDIQSLDDTNKSCDSKIKRSIGILDIESFNNSFLNNKSYLCTALGFAVSNKIDNDIINAFAGGNNCLDIVSNQVLSGIRPVITLKSNLIIISGYGTNKSPYKLEDYKYAKQQDKLNTRLVGEYVNYSGSVYRIIGNDKDNNVTLISVKPIYKNISNMVGKEYLIASLDNNKHFVFNTNENNSVGYLLNKQYIDYLNDKHIIEKNYKIPLNVLDKNYNNYDSKKVTAKLVLPKTYDFFAGKQIDNVGYMYEYIFIDESENEQNIFFVDLRNARVYDGIKNTSECTMRIVMTINGNLLIKDGKGTVNSPYYVR